MHTLFKVWVAEPPNLLNSREDYELRLWLHRREASTCPLGQVCKTVCSPEIYVPETIASDYCTDSSNSFIQFLPFNTSRGRVPSGGPTIPSFSMMSIKCAARP